MPGSSLAFGLHESEVLPLLALARRPVEYAQLLDPFPRLRITANGTIPSPSIAAAPRFPMPAFGFDHRKRHFVPPQLPPPVEIEPPSAGPGCRGGGQEADDLGGGPPI
ncbi:hypothetical protein B296_00049264 [Ensete ventricosum]|uniref:Uncharacterized protein n=1 Tax=Ensete ventricosum TaxID=4639 RepID=A0A426XFZ2_ENSVE|nr:hypothetical protein B296_00049264 [Ensete ventricosum]